MRGPRWVYARYFEQEPVYEELYDLAQDPLEAHNRAADPALAEVLAPAIAYAENGFPVSELIAFYWDRSVERLSTHPGFSWPCPEVP